MLSTIIVLVSLLTRATFTAAAGGTSILYDPGPRHVCYGWKHFDANPAQSTAECGPFEVVGRKDSKCQDFGAFVGGDSTIPTCPTWKFDSEGWSSPAQVGANPGFDGTFTGGNGELVNITIKNLARDMPDGNCSTLYEVAFSFDEYSSSVIHYLHNDWVETTVDFPSNGTAAHLVVDYNILIDDLPDALADDTTCTQRRFVTTDFIYWYTAADNTSFTNVLSLLHSDPKKFSSPSVPWHHQDGNGCRYMVPYYPIDDGVPTPVHLDFSALLETYKADLCHNDTLPTHVHPKAVQINTSNVRSNSIVHLNKIDVQLVDM